MSYEPEAKTRLYHVKTWTPPSDKDKWGSHRTYGVIANSAIEAMKGAQEEWPMARIDAVNDGGVVHLNLRAKDSHA